MNTLDRRRFLVTSGAAVASLGVQSVGAQTLSPQPWGTGGGKGEGGAKPNAGAVAQPDRPGDAHRGVCVVSSGNGLPATGRAMELIAGGTHPLDAIVAGIKIVEDDPNDMSVGYGGLPNEEGIVELDASVMDGTLHRAGSVGALRNIKNPAGVALLVMRRTDHVMLVGEGALKFARAMGFPEEDLLTEAAREAWLRWKANLGHDDDWLNDDEREDRNPDGPGARGGAGGLGGRVLPDRPIPFTTGTIHCSAVDGEGRVAACTSTSGLSYKLAGRLGDSPIVGAGMYCDGAVGSAGATGRGEAVMQVCGAFSVVQHLERGLGPTEACLAVLRRIADRTREKRLLDARGRPNFNVSLYAMRKDGAYGAAALWSGAKFTVHDGTENRTLGCGFLFEKE